MRNKTDLNKENRKDEYCILEASLWIVIDTGT